MSTSTIIMMVVGLGAVWGGAVVTVAIALAADKKNNFHEESNKVIGQ